MLKGEDIMDYYLCIYSSVTLATRVRKQLSKDGEYVGMLHTPKAISKGGCSYALRFKKNKLAAAKKVSEQLGIKIKGIYREVLEDDCRYYEEVK